jgi:hypothetical protein
MARGQEDQEDQRTRGENRMTRGFRVKVENLSSKDRMGSGSGWGFGFGLG